jgi:hypothetical protein
MGAGKQSSPRGDGYAVPGIAAPEHRPIGGRGAVIGSSSTWSRSPPLPAYANYTTTIPNCQSINMMLASPRLSEMRLECTQRGNQDAGGRLLAHAPPVPALLKRPFLQRLLPSDHVPYTRTAGGAEAANGQSGAPNHPARVLDPGPGLFHRSKAAAAANFWARDVKGAQRVELRNRKTISEILSGLPHSRSDRASSFHHRESVDKAIGSAGATGSITDRPF